MREEKNDLKYWLHLLEVFVNKEIMAEDMEQPMLVEDEPSYGKRKLFRRLPVLLVLGLVVTIVIVVVVAVVDLNTKSSQSTDSSNDDNTNTTQSGSGGGSDRFGNIGQIDSIENGSSPKSPITGADAEVSHVAESNELVANVTIVASAVEREGTSILGSSSDSDGDAFDSSLATDSFIGKPAIVLTSEDSEGATTKPKTQYEGGQMHKLQVPSRSRQQVVDVYTPTSYDHDGDPMPLVVMLHGLGGSGPAAARTQGMHQASEDLGFVYVAPTAVNRGGGGRRAWCATPGCCCSGGNDSYESDSLFLGDMIQEIIKEFNIDEDKVYIIGVSNGGFMSYRLACDYSELIAGIMPICGSNYYDLESSCRASSPVHVLHIHGTRDRIIPYGGGRNSRSASGNVYNWATVVNGCSSTFEESSTARSDYLTIPSNHGWGNRLQSVNPIRYIDDGCLADTELWTVPGVGHW